MATCSKCNTNKYDDDTWNCDSCKRPLCTKCGGLTASEIKCLQLKKRVLLFFCEDCRNGLCQVPMLRSEIADLRQHIDEFIKSNKAIPTKAQDTQENKFEENFIEEINERMRRKNNLLIFGVEDSNNKEADQRMVTQVISEIDANINIENYSIYRLGNFNANKKRPIKIIMDNEEQVINVVKKGHRLRNNANIRGRISLAQDRTPRQVQYYNDLKKKLMERQANGESNIRIRYVRGVPKIIELNKNKNSDNLNM